MKPSKTYLGDGVYADTDAQTGDIVLTTEDGLSVTNRIVIDPHVWRALVEFTVAAGELAWE